MEETLKHWSAEASGILAKQMIEGVSPDGTPYAPLRRPRGPGHNQQSGPLIDKGDMLRSLSSGADHVEEFTKDSVKVGTKDRKAEFHQYGTSKMVARPFADINDAIVDAGVEALERLLERRLNS